MPENLRRPTGNINPNESNDRNPVAGDDLNQEFTLQIQLSGGEPSGEIGAGSRETVLVVEDDQPLRILVSEGLRLQGYQILSAADGLQALQLAEHRSARIDALVTDVIMPHVYGTEVARRLADIWPRLAIIYMSGCVHDGFNFNELLTPSRVFLSKPFTLDQLRRKLRDALDSRDGQRSAA